MNQLCIACNTVKPLSEFPKRGIKQNYVFLGTVQSTYDNRCNACKAAYAKEFRKKNPGYRGTGKLKRIPKEDRLLASAISHRLTCATGRSKKSNLPLPSVDRDYLYQLFKKQDGKCAVSGVTMKIEKGAVTCLSLDQITPGLGYVEGNIQWVAWAVNRAKGDMSTEIFHDMCRQVVDYQKAQRLS